MERHNDMYFTLWYGVFDKQKRQLTYANGGHPPAILMGGSAWETAELIELSQRGTMIGVAPDTTFKAAVVDLPEFSRLYVFSDGVFEVTRPDDTMTTYAEFVSTLSGSKRATVSPIEHVIGAIRTVRGGDQFEDDVSIIEVTL